MIDNKNVVIIFLVFNLLVTIITILNLFKIMKKRKTVENDLIRLLDILDKKLKENEAKMKLTTSETKEPLVIKSREERRREAKYINKLKNDLIEGMR